MPNQSKKTNVYIRRFSALSSHWFWILLALIPSALSAKIIEKQLHISADIYKAQLFDYSLYITTNPTQLYLVWDRDQKKFKTENVNIVISTDIPTSELGMGFKYNLTLNENTSECKHPYSGNLIIIRDFIHLKLDFLPFEVGQTLRNAPLYDVGGPNIGANRTLSLVSDNINDQALECSGVVELEAELAL